MGYKRRKNKRRKNRLGKVIPLVLCIIIILTLSFLIKDLFFDGRKPVQASQEDLTALNNNAPEENIPPSENQKELVLPSSPDSIDTTQDNNIRSSSEEDQKPSQETQNPSDKNTGSQPDQQQEIDYKKALKDSVFLGDSITQALSYYKYINSSHVIADRGHTARKAIDEIDKIARLEPDNVFILFGLNDILTDKNSDRFINNYTRLIQELKAKLPNTNIYIQSILPVDSKAEAKTSTLSNSRIQEFNQGLKTLAEEEDIYYLDVASMVLEYGKNLHEPDGIHYKPKFCTLWLEYIINHI